MYEDLVDNNTNTIIVMAKTQKPNLICFFLVN